MDQGEVASADANLVELWEREVSKSSDWSQRTELTCFRASSSSSAFTAKKLAAVALSTKSPSTQRWQSSTMLRHAE